MTDPPDTRAIRNSAAYAVVHGTLICSIAAMTDPQLLGNRIAYGLYFLPWFGFWFLFHWEVGLSICLLEIIAGIALYRGVSLARYYLRGLAIFGSLAHPLSLMWFILPYPSSTSAGASDATTLPYRTSISIAAALLESASYIILWYFVARRATQRGMEFQLRRREAARYQFPDSGHKNL